MDNIVFRALIYVQFYSNFINSDSPVVTDSLLDLLFHCLSCHTNWSLTPVFITDALSSVLKSFHPFVHSPDSNNYLHTEPLFSCRFQKVSHPLTTKNEQRFVALPRCKLTVERPCCTNYCAGSYCSIVTTPVWHITKEPFCVQK
jgi:hypothetical protein